MPCTRRVFIRSAAIAAAVAMPAGQVLADYNGPDDDDSVIEPDESDVSWYPSEADFDAYTNDNGIRTAILKFQMMQDEIDTLWNMSTSFDIEFVIHGFDVPDDWDGTRSATLSTDNYLAYSTQPKVARRDGAIVPRIIGIDVSSLAADTTYTVQLDLVDLPAPDDGWASVSFDWVLRDWNVERGDGDECDAISLQNGVSMCGTNIASISLSEEQGVYIGFDS